MGFHDKRGIGRGAFSMSDEAQDQYAFGMDMALSSLTANVRGFSFVASPFDFGLSSFFGPFSSGFTFGNLIIGTPGDNTLKGNNKDNIIFGLAGDDTIKGRGGDDWIIAGSGDDNVNGGRGDDIIFGGKGDDFVSGGKGDDTIQLGAGNDTGNGGKGDDLILGGIGDDLLKGGKGDDFINGGEGEDTAVFSGKLKHYEIDRDAGTVRDLRKGKDGTDTLVDVEYLQFKDQTVSLVEPEVFTLELLHFADQEAGVAAIQDAPNLSAVLNALRGQDLGDDGVADNTLTLSSGDAFIPGLFYDASEAVFGSGGIADIQIQNELGVQAIALGNHEFDFGTGDLAGLISGDATGDFGALSGTALDGQDFTGTDMPYLSANLNYASDDSLAPLEVEGGQAPQGNSVSSSTVIDVNGELIGIVGATTPTLGSISSPGTVGISPSWAGSTPTSEELDALAVEIQEEVDLLLAANPEMNKVILLAHMQQISIELALAERLENVDIIVAGGSNTRLFDENDRARDGDSVQGEYPTFVTNAGGTATAVVNTDGSYKYVGRLVIDFDADGNIITDSYDVDVSGAYATDDQGVQDLGAEDLIDPEIQAITDAIQEQIVATESNVFGISNVFLNGNRSGTGEAGDPDGVRTQETNLGNLTADANLAYANELLGDDEAPVVISLKNGGGIRASIGQTVVLPGGDEPVRLPNEQVVNGDGDVVKPEGGISQNDIQTTLAFNNGLIVLTLTKEEIVDLLEYGLSAVPGVEGRFPQLSGIKMSYDDDLPVGGRIINAGIFDENDSLIAELVRDGEISGEATATFRVVTLDFLATPRFNEETGAFIGGGDGYPFPNLNTDPEAGELGDPDVIARINPTPLEQEGVTSGDADFADDGTEQDALAEYLFDNHNTAETAFDQEDTGFGGDDRIQNVDFREDDVFDGVVLPTEVVINEIRIDQGGDDNDEYFELFGEPNGSLDGLTYLVIGDGEGGSGVIEAVIDLSDFSLDENGYFVAAESTFSLGTANATTSLNFENSDNVTHLLVRGFTSAEGDDLDATDDGTLDSAPWSEVVDSVALVEEIGGGDQVYSDTVVGPDGSFVPGHVYRAPDGGDWQIGEFSLGETDTPGEANPEDADQPLDLAIYEIQGAGHRSAYENEAVRTTGVVTAIASNGFYMQDPDGDGDIATSDGIFVAGSVSGLAVGDAVDVTGSVQERQFGNDLSVTRISATNTEITSSGNALPAAVVLGVDRVQPSDVIDDDGLTSFDPETDAIDFLESLEGMRVEVDNPLVVAGTSRFGEMALAAGRGDESGTPGVKNAVVSEGDFNPEILLTDDALIDAPIAFTGDKFVNNPVGVMDYTFGAFKLQLTEEPEIVSGGLTPEVSTLTGDSTHMTIATVNAFNLDPSDGDLYDAEVDRLDVLARQIVQNLNAPDIVALQEIQDNTGPTDDGVTSASETLQELVHAIWQAGGPLYKFASVDPVDLADGGQPGANIQNAFLYDPTRVELDIDSLTKIQDSAFEEGGDGSDAEASYEGTRKPLVGDFTFRPTGETVTVIGNHLKSKSQDDGLFGEDQPPVQNTLAQRVDQASVINAYVEAGLAEGKEFIVLGDLNDFQFSDTLGALANGGDDTVELTNLVNFLDADDQYSFIFNGNSQQLDHILVSDALLATAEIDVVHANLDFGFPNNNASDHDPVLARIDMTGEPFTA